MICFLHQSRNWDSSASGSVSHLPSSYLTGSIVFFNSFHFGFNSIVNITKIVKIPNVSSRNVLYEHRLLEMLMN
jgi:hypothetical protein